MHVYDALVPPSVRRPELRIPSTLEAVAVRALAKRPEARQADARTLKAELEAALRELEAPAVHAARMPTQPSLQRVARRRRAITGAAVAVIAVLAAGAAWVRRQPTRVPAVTSSAGLEARVTASAIDPREAAGLAPAASAPRPNEVRLAFTSTPQGAQVFEGQELLGSCPLSLSRPRELGHVVLTFRHPGYRDEIRDITTDSPKDVFVVLAKRPQPKRPRPTRGMRPSARGQASDLRNPFE